jgi:hypothetical protein
MLRRVALVRANVSEELSASIIIWVTRIGELGKLDVTSNRHTLRRNFNFNLFRECVPPLLSLSVDCNIHNIHIHNIHIHFYDVIGKFIAIFYGIALKNPSRGHSPHFGRTREHFRNTSSAKIAKPSLSYLPQGRRKQRVKFIEFP